MFTPLRKEQRKNVVNKIDLSFVITCFSSRRKGSYKVSRGFFREVSLKPTKFLHSTFPSWEQERFECSRRLSPPCVTASKWVIDLLQQISLSDWSWHRASPWWKVNRLVLIRSTLDCMEMLGMKPGFSVKWKKKMSCFDSWVNFQTPSPTARSWICIYFKSSWVRSNYLQYIPRFSSSVFLKCLLSFALHSFFQWAECLGPKFLEQRWQLA